MSHSDNLKKQATELERKEKERLAARQKFLRRSADYKCALGLSGSEVESLVKNKWLGGKENPILRVNLRGKEIALYLDGILGSMGVSEYGEYFKLHGWPVYRVSFKKEDFPHENSHISVSSCELDAVLILNEEYHALLINELKK